MPDPAPTTPTDLLSSQGATPVIRTTFDNVFDRLTGDRKAVREPVSEAQLLGFWLAVSVLLLITFFVIGAVLYLMFAMPKITDFGVPTTDASMILWQKASTDTFQRVTSLIDQIVIRMLLPVLTLLLGYVFGTTIRRGASGNGDGG